MRQQAAFLMHSAWDYGKVFLAPTREEAMAKATAFAEALMLENWEGPDKGEGETKREWCEMCWEFGEWQLEEAETEE